MMKNNLTKTIFLCVFILFSIGNAVADADLSDTEKEAAVSL
jgi:hypothetical protein